MGGIWGGFMEVYPCFANQIGFVVGEGSRIRFWRDVWCGVQALERVFLALYRIAVNREASMLTCVYSLMVCICGIFFLIGISMIGNYLLFQNFSAYYIPRRTH